MLMHLLFALLALVFPLCASYPHTDKQRLAVQQIFDAFGLSDPDRECPLLWIQSGKERWDFDQRFEKRSEELLPLFQQAGLLDEVLPDKEAYDAILIHGATWTALQKRLLFAYELLEKGVQCRTLVFLGGYRALKDEEKTLDPSLATEMDMIHWLYLCTPRPEEMTGIEVEFIEGPAVWPNQRATTKDAGMAWLASCPKARSCLAISNQPYVEYQQAVLRSLLPEDYELETAGPGVSFTPSVALLLDTLGKIWITSAPIEGHARR